MVPNIRSHGYCDSWDFMNSKGPRFTARDVWDFFPRTEEWNQTDELVVGDGIPIPAMSFQPVSIGLVGPTPKMAYGSDPCVKRRYSYDHPEGAESPDAYVERLLKEIQRQTQIENEDWAYKVEQKRIEYNSPRSREKREVKRKKRAEEKKEREEIREQYRLVEDIQDKFRKDHGMDISDTLARDWLNKLDAMEEKEPPVTVIAQESVEVMREKWAIEQRARGFKP